MKCCPLHFPASIAGLHTPSFTWGPPTHLRPDMPCLVSSSLDAFEKCSWNWWSRFREGIHKFPLPSLVWISIPRYCGRGVSFSSLYLRLWKHCLSSMKSVSAAGVDPGFSEEGEGANGNAWRMAVAAGRMPLKLTMCA